jgi:hypothetical protein
MVELIDTEFSIAKTERDFPVYSKSAATLQAIVDLCGEIPGELVTISGPDYADYVQGLASLKDRVERWRLQGGNETTSSIRKQSPIVVIREALLKCRDDVPAPSTQELMFIKDAELRESIRLDLSSASNSLHNGEWKPATVMAGSTIEAMLLWAVQENPADVAKLSSLPPGAPERWDLAQLCSVVAALGYIKPETATQIDLARDFRNLIHPGRAQRKKQVCDRGTALSALAGAELTARDLTARFP